MADKDLAIRLRVQSEGAENIAKLDKEIEEVGHAGTATGDSLKNAFAVTGVRSAEAINAEIKEVRQALATLGKNAKVSGAEFDRAFAAGQAKIAALKAELNGVGDSSKKSSGMLSGFASGVVGTFAGVATALAAASAAVRGFITTNIELQRNERVLRAITGSAEAARREYSFLEAQADKLGVSVLGLSKEYIGLLSASRGTALEGEGIRKVFSSITSALAATGASSQQTSSALMAVQQILGKGTVSMEEVRQQLGEAMPIAFQAAAKGMGVTTGELSKMIAAGDMVASHFVKSFGEGLDAMVGSQKKVAGLEQSFERLKNTLVSVAKTAGDSGVMKALAEETDQLAEILKLAGNAMKGLGTQTEELGQKSIEWYDVIIKPYQTWLRVAGDVAKEANKKIEADRAQIEELKRYNAEMGKREEKDRVSIEIWRQQNKEITESADKAKMQHFATLALADAQNALAAAANRSTEDQIQLATGMSKARYEARLQATDFNGVLGLYNLWNKELEISIDANQKLLEARKNEAAALTQSVALTGSDADAKHAAATAADAVLNQSVRLTAAREQEVENLKNEMALLLQKRMSQSGLAEDEKKALDALEQKLLAKKADLEQSKSATGQYALESTAAKVQAETYLDNAKRIDEYRQKADVLTQTLRTMEMAQAQGAVTEQSVQAARRSQAEAVALYTDAINDNIAAKQREGAMSVQMAQIAGNEKGTLDASALAAQNNAAAIAGISEKRREELAAIQNEIAGIQQYKNIVGSLPGNMEAYLTQLERQKALKEEEISNADRATAAARVEADVAKMRSAAWEDNSSRLYELQGAANAAANELARLRAAKDAGLATEAQVNEAAGKAAAAQALYKDAVNDAADALKRKQAVQQHELNLEMKGLELSLESARTDEQVALSQGRERDAIEAKIRQKNIEISITRTKIEIQRAEIEGERAQVELEIKRAEANGELNQAKREEFELRLKSLEIKELEASKGSEIIRRLDEEVDALDRLKNAKSNSMQQTHADTEALKRNTAALKENREERSAGAMNYIGIVNWLKSAGMDEAKAKLTAKQFVNGNGEVIYYNNPGQKQYGGSTLTEALGRAAAQDAMYGKSKGSQSDSSSKSNHDAPTAPQQLQPITINLGGKSHSFELGGAAQVSSLENVLKQLSQSAARS